MQNEIDLLTLTLAKNFTKSQIESLGYAIRYTGSVPTKADLLLVTGMKNGDLKIVLADESYGGKRNTYIYNISNWEFLCEANVDIRDFKLNPIILTDGINKEVSGTLSQSNIDMVGIAKLSDLLSKVNTTDIIDNLTSSDVNKPLSALQGKNLNDTKLDKTLGVTKTGTEILTNKTISATNNTLTNIDMANFNAGLVDIDGSLTANSDAKLSSQKAVKTYVDNKNSGDIKYIGVLDASNLGTQLDNTKKGNLFKVSVAGTILTSLILNIGDMIVINKDVTGTPTVNDIDKIDNSESLDNPITVDPSINITTLPNGYYVSDGLFNVNNGYPFTTTVGTSHNTIIISGNSGYKLICLYNSNTTNCIYTRTQFNGGWNTWNTFYTLITLTVNRKNTEIPIYGWGVNGVQVYAILSNGNAPTNSSILLKSGLTSTARLIDIDGWILNGTLNQRVPITRVVANTTDLGRSPVYQDPTTGSIYMYINNTDYNNQPYEITLYYTK